MYRRILVPLDGSTVAEQVLPCVKLLSKGLQIPITLLRVTVTPSIDLVDPEHGAFLNEIAESQQHESQAYLDNMAEALRKEGLEVSVITLAGEPASGIVTESDSESGTLVAMCTHGRSGITRWVMGSVSDKVLHATRSPMLVVRAEDSPASRITLNNVIIPLDGSELAEQVLPHAITVAKGLNLKATILRVTPSAGDYFRYMDYPPADYEDLSKEVDDDAVKYLDTVNRRLKMEGVSQTEERLIHGSAAFAITDYIREVPNSLVAMTTHGRSGIGRWVMGSVADRVVRHSGGPVLMVRAVQEE